MHFRLFSPDVGRLDFRRHTRLRPGGHHQPGACRRHRRGEPRQAAARGVQGQNWWVVASVVVTVVVWLLRTKLPKLMPQTEGFSRTPWCRCRCPSSPPLASGILTAALAGPITAAILPSLLSDVLKVAFGAIAIFVAGKVAEAREAVP